MVVLSKAGLLGWLPLAALSRHCVMRAGLNLQVL